MAEEPKKEQEIVQKTVIPPTNTPPFLPQVYINGAQVQTGFFEIRLILTETIPTGPNEITTKGLLSVIMPPECLKLLYETLRRSIAQYEEQFGKLRNLPSEALSESPSDPHLPGTSSGGS